MRAGLVSYCFNFSILSGFCFSDAGSQNYLVCFGAEPTFRTVFYTGVLVERKLHLAAAACAYLFQDYQSNFMDSHGNFGVIFICSVGLWAISAGVESRLLFVFSQDLGFGDYFIGGYSGRGWLVLQRQLCFV